MKSKCEACQFFDCGDKCSCTCHHGEAPKIRSDLDPEDAKQPQKTEEKMEGLSSLFG